MRADRAKHVYLQAETERAEGDESNPYRDDAVHEVEECKTPPPSKTRSLFWSFRGKQDLNREFRDNRVEGENSSEDGENLGVYGEGEKVDKDADSVDFENEGDDVGGEGREVTLGSKKKRLGA